MSKKTTGCINHPKRPTPLISTFVIKYREWYCPYCGDFFEFVESRRIDLTDEIEERARVELAHATPFLEAIRTRDDILFNDMSEPVREKTMKEIREHMSVRQIEREANDDQR